MNWVLGSANVRRRSSEGAVLQVCEGTAAAAKDARRVDLRNFRYEPGIRTGNELRSSGWFGLRTAVTGVRTCGECEAQQSRSGR